MPHPRENVPGGFASIGAELHDGGNEVEHSRDAGVEKLLQSAYVQQKSVNTSRD